MTSAHPQIHTHHQHVRKRVHKNLEQYPHKDSFVRGLDKLIIFLAVVGPATSLPQIIAIYSTQQVEGVSLLSWSLYTVLTLPWLTYGIVHKELPIIISNILLLIVNISVVTGILLYS